MTWELTGIDLAGVPRPWHQEWCVPSQLLLACPCASDPYARRGEGGGGGCDLSGQMGFRSKNEVELTGIEPAGVPRPWHQEWCALT